MNTKADIPSSGRIDISGKVVGKRRARVEKRDWELKLEDQSGKRIPLILWKTHQVNGEEFSVGRWYRFTEARGKYGNELHSTSDLDFERTQPPNAGPTEILHLSDSHIGYRLRGRSDGYNQSTVGWMGDIDCLERFRTAIEIAVEREVDAVLHTGDIFDDVVNKKHLHSVGELLDGILGEAGIPFYYIHGNHDPDEGREILEKSEVAEHLSAESPKKVGGKVHVYGVDHRSMSWWRNRSLGLRDGASGDGYNVLCLHQSITPIRPESNGPSISAETLLEKSNVDLDLLALGHEHYFYEGEVPEHGCKGFYPGPTERISKRYRKRPPFVNLYTFSDGIDRERISVD